MRTLERQASPDVPTIQRLRWKAINAALGMGNRPPPWTPGTQEGSSSGGAIQLNPGSVEAATLDQLGKCLISLGQEREAIENFSAAIRLNPERIDIYTHKARGLALSAHRGRAGSREVHGRDDRLLE